MRLDQYLVSEGLAPSRNIAQQLIKEGHIRIDDTVVTKSAFKVLDRMQVTQNLAHIYVGRAALKLKAFLEEHPLDIKDKNAIDVGSSTGGFTEILLEHHVGSVVCVDIGKDQLHERIKNSPKVTSIEEQDIRTFNHEPFELLTCDVSFISVHHILESLDRLVSGDIVILFKPQYEVGVEVKRNRAGVVLDKIAIEKSQERFLQACEALGWILIYQCDSKLEGKEGNREYFYHFRSGH